MRISPHLLSTNPPRIGVRLGEWIGTNVNATVTCGDCGPNLSAGSVLQVLLHAVPQCRAFGCSAALNSTSVDAPFEIVNVSPGLPAVLPRAGATFELTVRAPASGGSFSLNGSASGTPLPGPVVVTNQDWSVRNRTNSDEGVLLRPPAPLPELAPSALFNVTLTVNNSASRIEQIRNVSIVAPFLLVSALPGFPFPVDPNMSGDVVTEIRAPPTSGSYVLTGVLGVGPLPVITIAAVEVNFSGSPIVLGVAQIDFPTQALPGEEFNGSVQLTNPTNLSHAVVLNRTTGPWIFINCTPNSSATLIPGASVRFYLTLSAKSSVGSFVLTIWFRMISEPVRRPS
jgi:hypothetical protein